MKWIICGICAFLLSALLCLAPIFGGGGNDEYLRIHVRANSNSVEDQNVKYFVKDAIVEALIPILANASTKEEAKSLLSANLGYINEVADEALRQSGMKYSSSSKICREVFPTRVYDELTLPAGEYDAVIVELGSGRGDNWWCLVYPAFCFTKTKNSQNVKYVSKILEIINKIKNK